MQLLLRARMDAYHDSSAGQMRYGRDLGRGRSDKSIREPRASVRGARPSRTYRGSGRASLVSRPPRGREPLLRSQRDSGEGSDRLSVPTPPEGTSPGCPSAQRPGPSRCVLGCGRESREEEVARSRRPGPRLTGTKATHGRRSAARVIRLGPAVAATSLTPPREPPTSRPAEPPGWWMASHRPGLSITCTVFRGAAGLSRLRPPHLRSLRRLAGDVAAAFFSAAGRCHFRSGSRWLLVFHRGAGQLCHGTGHEASARGWLEGCRERAGTEERQGGAACCDVGCSSGPGNDITRLMSFAALRGGERLRNGGFGRAA